MNNNLNPTRSTRWAAGVLRSALALLILLISALAIAVPSASASPGGHHAKLAHTAQSCANADAPAVSVSSNAIRVAIVCLINQDRVSHSLPALHDQPLLDRSAQGWNNNMTRSANVSHGVNFAARITAVGYVWSSAGENIASGFTTPRAVVSGWMQSAGHCYNILTPSFSDVGTGVGRDASGTVWTQDFGLRMGQHAPSTNWGPAKGCPYAN